MNIFIFILLLLLIVCLAALIKVIIKRAVAIARLKGLAKENKKIKLKFTRNHMASLFKMSHAPDFTVEVGNKIYLARYYNGRGSKSQVHFANEEYSAVFSILLVRTLMGTRSKNYTMGVDGRAPQSTTSIRRKVRIIPKLTVPNEYKHAEARGKEICPVFIFNPAPSNVSYVSDEKTSIKLAFTGDKFRDTMIFTGSTFVRYLDRESRYTDGYDQNIIFHSEI